MPITEINSDTLIPIDRHFRIAAGPGAGKTHWLINHIKNVLTSSNRLYRTRKIACITYTNIAVKTILERLESSSNIVEVSTIHSFLYKNIVKHYVSFIADDYGLNLSAIEGHDDYIISNYKFLKEWKEKTGQQRIKDNQGVIEAFKASRWKYNENGELVNKPDYPHSVDGYPIKSSAYNEYKKMAWGKGVLHHDDVLYFSNQLVKEYPFILEVLRAKFPYFFVDEFQDTNPIQTKLLETIGQEETIVGIIGDRAQSIYSFQGAAPEQFDSINLQNLKNYVISDNRRSTKLIVNLLNSIRHDIKQKAININIKNGTKPLLIIGGMIEAYRRAKNICKDEPLYSLSRDNLTVNAMRLVITKNVPHIDLLQNLNVSDSNSNRKKTIITSIKSIELARQKNFKKSIKELRRIFKYSEDKEKAKKRALGFLSYLLLNYNQYYKKSLYEFHIFVKEYINTISTVTSGEVLNYYKKHTYQELATCVNIIEPMGYHNTIHKSKGAEYENVILILKNEQDLSFITNPNLDDEEHRIYYVAISRAKRGLYINVPTLSENNKSIINALFNIEYLSDND